MKNEDVQLNIKEIFERKGVDFTCYDIARARHVCRNVIEFLLENQKQNQSPKVGRDLNDKK